MNPEHQNLEYIWLTLCLKTLTIQEYHMPEGWGRAWLLMVHVCMAISTVRLIHHYYISTDDTADSPTQAGSHLLSLTLCFLQINIPSERRLFWIHDQESCRKHLPLFCATLKDRVVVVMFLQIHVQ